MSKVIALAKRKEALQIVTNLGGIPIDSFLPVFMVIFTLSTNNMDTNRVGIFILPLICYN